MKKDLSLKVEVGWRRPAMTCTDGIQAEGFTLVQMLYSEDCHYPFSSFNRADGNTIGIKKHQVLYMYVCICGVVMIHREAVLFWLNTSIMQKERNLTIWRKHEGPKDRRHICIIWDQGWHGWIGFRIPCRPTLHLRPKQSNVWMHKAPFFIGI